MLGLKTSEWVQRKGCRGGERDLGFGGTRGQPQCKVLNMYFVRESLDYLIIYVYDI